MKNKIPAIFCLAAVLVAALSSLPANAQLSNMMQSMSGSSAMSGLTGSAMPSVSSASPTNLAGVIQYCAQNNYLGGGASGQASSVKSSLLSKFTGSSTPPSSDSGYSAGSLGVLNTGGGQTATLGGTGLKAKMTSKVCGLVLSHAKSML